MPPDAADDASPRDPFTTMTRQAWAVLGVLSGTIFLEGLDVSMMGVALPSMRADLGLSTGALQWVVSAYVLGYGGFVLLGGRAADLFGRRRMFLLWLGVFIAFSGLGGLAVGGWMLIVARFVTGVSAGFLTPASLSIITTSFAAGEVRNRALLVYGGVGAGGFTLGMVAGGLLTTVGWRWVFFAPVIVAAVLWALAVRHLTERPAVAGRPRGVDVAGAVTLTGGMLVIVLARVRAPEVPAAVTLATSSAGMLALAAFVAVERRSPSPLIRLGILRSAPLVRADLGARLFVGAFIGFQFVLVRYLQELRGWSALVTGLALTVAGVDMILAPTVTPWFVRRYGEPAGGPGGDAARGGVVRDVPADRRGLVVPDAPARAAPRGPGIRGGVRPARDRRHRRCRRRGAGPRRRAVQRVDAVRWRARAGRRHGGQPGRDRRRPHPGRQARRPSRRAGGAPRRRRRRRGAHRVGAAADLQRRRRQRGHRQRGHRQRGHRRREHRRPARRPTRGLTAAGIGQRTAMARRPIPDQDPSPPRRALARARMPLVATGAVVLVAGVLARAPRPVVLTGLTVFAVGFALYVRAGTPVGRVAELRPPVDGRWRAMNSPTTRVPSHGVHAWGQTYAIDLVADPGGGDRPGFGLWPIARRPEDFPAFGRPVRAPVDGEVVRVRRGWRDHWSRTSPLAILYLAVESVREIAGPSGVVGNHVVIRGADDTCVLLAHLRHRSPRVEVGDRVSAGDVVAECGNSGNSTEPHLHLQVMDRPSPWIGSARPFRFGGEAPPANQQHLDLATGVGS
jgi:MFS family permease/murein DD-endopeptidase MepM/ murein hydrolase activator NlpD